MQRHFEVCPRGRSVDSQSFVLLAKEERHNDSICRMRVCAFGRCYVGGVIATPDLRACGYVGGEILQSGGPYPLGVDPAWRGTTTELPYLNR